MMPASISSMLVNSLFTKNVRSRPGTIDTSFGSSSSWKMYATSISPLLQCSEVPRARVDHLLHAAAWLGLVLADGRKRAVDREILPADNQQFLGRKTRDH